MKLRNKKTGEIGTLTLSSNGEDLLIMKNNEMVTHSVKLSDLEEWEDAPEEPKEYWYIDTAMVEVTYNTLGNDTEVERFNKEIGNYFETKEEAEKAVEKLKAWKRLKDKEFEFVELRAPNYGSSSIITIKANCLWNSKNIDDLKICFGGEE